MQAALDGIRVLDFGRFIAGPYCAALLADMGAEVIRVDKRDGSEDRTLVPVMRAADGGPGDGAMYMQMNRNKKGLTLDPSHPDGRNIVRRLIATADVVVVNMPPQTLRQLGLDWETVHAINPRTILTSVTAFGTGGPYEERLGFDGVAQCMSGAVYLSGTPGAPARTVANWVDFGTASLAAFGTVTALLARQTTGRGQHVEGALLRTAVNFMGQLITEQAIIGRNREGTGNRGQTVAPSDIFQCRDGWIIILINGDPQFRRVARVIGEEGWLSDPRFATDELRGDNGAAISERCAQWCATRTTAEALAALETAKVPAGPVLRPQAVLDDPHTNAAGFFASFDYPGLGTARTPATPVVLSDTPGAIRRGPPQLGEHTDEILGGLGLGPAEISALRASGVI